MKLLALKDILLLKLVFGNLFYFTSFCRISNNKALVVNLFLTLLHRLNFSK